MIDFCTNSRHSRYHLQPKSRVCIDNVFFFRDTVRKYVIIIFKSNISCNYHIENCAVKNVIFHFKKDIK